MTLCLSRDAEGKKS